MRTGLRVYQWQKNGAPIPGADAANYTTAPETTAADRVLFAVVVSSNGFGKVRFLATDGKAFAVGTTGMAAFGLP